MKIQNAFEAHEAFQRKADGPRNWSQSMSKGAVGS